MAVLPDDPDFEPNLFLLQRDVRRLPVRIDGVGFDFEEVRNWARFDAIVSKTGSIAPDFAARFRPRLRDDLAAWMAGSNRDPTFTLWKTWPLPDGSEAQVFWVSR